MAISPSIGLIGDHDPQVTAHRAIPLAISLASRILERPIRVEWLHTSTLASDARRRLADFCGLWCVPGSPYACMEGALTAIRFARERRVPFLGTCGGFQHALIEYFRDVLGIADADHEETNPGAVCPVISRLSCSLVEQSGPIRLLPGTRVAEIYGSATISERYHCNFGMNPRYAEALRGGDLRVSGTDEEGNPRIIELADHPSFMATLFQPERSALENRPHPLIVAFVQAAAHRHS